MEMIGKCILILVSVSALESTLKQRVHNLETRVALDVMEFRNDISQLKDAFNETCKTIDENKEPPKRNADDTDNLKTYAAFIENLKTVTHRGFVAEKVYLRKAKDEIENKINAMNRKLENTDMQNQVLFSKLNSLEESLIIFHNRQTENNQEIKRIKETFLHMENDIVSDKDQLLRLDDRINTVDLENNAAELRTAKLSENIKMIKAILLCLQSGWRVYNNSCYMIIIRPTLAWIDAVNSCKSMNSYLLEVDDARENRYIANLVTEAFWIGASDTVSEGTFIWNHSKRKIDEVFTNWRPHEPNGGKGENCITVTMDGNKWNDLPCQHCRVYVCEKQIEI